MSTPESKLSGLSAAEKRQLLAERLRQRAASTPAVSPLSYGQKAMLYLQRLDPANSAYNGAFAVVLEDANLDVPALRQAVGRIVARHSILRTTYEARDGKFVQVIHSRREVEFAAEDASRWTREQLDRRMHEISIRSYDLEQ